LTKPVISLVPSYLESLSRWGRTGTSDQVDTSRALHVSKKRMYESRTQDASPVLALACTLQSWLEVRKRACRIETALRVANGKSSNVKNTRKDTTERHPPLVRSSRTGRQRQRPREASSCTSRHPARPTSSASWTRPYEATEWAERQPKRRTNVPDLSLQPYQRARKQQTTSHIS